jgi:hypothetical protein
LKKQFVMIFVAIVMSMFIIQMTLAAGELSPATGPEIVVPEAQTEFDEILADIEADRGTVVDDLVNSLAKDDRTAEQLRATLDGLSTFELAEIVQNAHSLDVVTTILAGKTPEELAEEIIPLGETDRDFAYTAVKPCRIIDTRIAGGAFSPGAIRAYYVYGSLGSQGGSNCTSPRGEPRAVHINVTAVPVSGPGNFRAYPANVSPPNASLVNYKAGVQNVANAGTIQTYYSLGSTEIAFLNSNGTSHLIVDVLGYYHETKHLAGADNSSGDAHIALTATSVTVKSVNITAPAAGKVIVNVSGYFNFNNSSAVDVGRCSIVSGSSTNIDFSHLIIGSERVDGINQIPFAATRGYSVSMGGSYTFRLNCNRFSGNVYVDDASINAIWVPNTY